MADILTNEELTEQIEILKVKLAEVAENTGGILSGGDIRRRIICKEEQDKYLKMFEKRDWKVIKNTSWEKTSDSENGSDATKRFVIKDYNEVNVTPFSYDLSLGDQVFSIQKPKTGIVALKEEMPYLLKPGETVVVITAEKIAIPHAYSATVWPRFNMVKRGVFQSMVKIDPTWYGKLAISMSNLSPAEVELNHGEAFATLLFYELSKDSDVDLWKLENLQEMGIEEEEEIPQEFLKETDEIVNYILKEKLRGYYRLKGNLLTVRGIKRKEVDALKGCFTDKVWFNFVDQLAKKWTDKKYGNPPHDKRMIVMPALGMENLWDIVKGLGDKGYVKEESIRGMTLESNEPLIGAAVKYGEPFDLFASIPNTIVKRIENETIPRIEAEIQSKIQTRVILLVFSLFGFMSLVITIFVLLWRIGGKDFLMKFSNWSGLYATMTTVGGTFGFIFLCLSFTYSGFNS